MSTMLLRIEQMFYFIVVITFLTLCLAIPTYMVIRENFITSPRYNLCMIFMAPSGAQGVTIFVSPFVRPSGSSLSRAFSLHHSGSGLFQEVSLRFLLVFS